jgi:hypothetical protein
MFLANHGTSGSFFIIFSSVAPHRGQPSAKCHPRWQPTRGLAVSCGLGRRWIWTLDCRTTVWCATIEPPRLPLSHHASLMYQYLGGRVARWPLFIGIRKKQPAQKTTHPRLFTSNSFLSTTCYNLNLQLPHSKLTSVICGMVNCAGSLLSATVIRGGIGRGTNLDLSLIEPC